MPLEPETLARIDAALAHAEGFLHLHHGTACLDENGESFSPLDCAAAIDALRDARNRLGVTACPPIAVAPAREVLPDFWPTRDLSRFRDSAPRTDAVPNIP